MSQFPTGRRTLDGVEYSLGSKTSGALLLDNSDVKPGRFPEDVTSVLGANLKKLTFLYTAAFTRDSQTINGHKVRIAVPEVARFIIRYSDGSTTEAPIILGRHIYDWWADPPGSNTPP
jgi:hypothetical protein